MDLGERGGVQGIEGRASFTSGSPQVEGCLLRPELKPVSPGPISCQTWLTCERRQNPAVAGEVVRCVPEPSVPCHLCFVRKDLAPPCSIQPLGTQHEEPMTGLGLCRACGKGWGLVGPASHRFLPQGCYGRVGASTGHFTLQQTFSVTEGAN